MAAYNPPTEQLPIFDNSVFNSINGDTVLTVSIANLLYLRKTFPDIATALETFSAGIAVNTIQPITSSGTITIGTSSDITTINSATINLQNTDTIGGTVNIKSGITSTGDVNIKNIAGTTTVATAGTVNIGSGTGGASTLYSTPINMSTGTNTGAITIGSSTALFGNSTFLKSSTISLQNDTAAAGTINIKNGQSSAGDVNIKSIAGTTTVTTGGSVNIGAGVGGALSLYSVPVAINTGTNTGLITIGSSTALFGNTTNLKSSTISLQNDAATAGTLNIKNGTSSTGDINIKSNAGTTLVATAGSVNIGAGVGATSTLYSVPVAINTGTNTGTITIGSATALFGNTTNLSSTTTNLNGAIIMGTGGTSFRCIIIKQNVTGLASGTITIPGAPTTFGIPLIFITMNKTVSGTPYFINANPTTASTFDFTKLFYNTTTSVINNASSETFNYMAVWL